MPRGRKASDSSSSLGTPNPTDVHVGRRVRQRRTLLGMSQERLGAALGLTFQQVQKYERGVNRIGSSRLYDLAQVLRVPVSYFFDEMEAASTARGGVRGLSDGEQEPYEPDIMSRKETMDLVRAYYAIPDTQTRRRLLDLAKAMAQAGRS